MKVLRTAFLLTALTLALIVVGDAFGGLNGMKIALGFAVLLNAVAYFFSDKIALLSSGAKPVSREQLPRLYEVMERLALFGPRGSAERVRHRPKSASRLRGRYPRIVAIDER